MKSKAIFQVAFVSVLLFAFFLSPSSALAARNITITTNKSVLFGFDEMTVTIASLSGFTNGETIYIKGAFYKDGTSSYFGYTKNNDSWIKNGDSTSSQRQIQIGNWDQTLIVKSDFEDSGYKGEGDYKFKVGFYYLTSGGNVSSVNWSTNSTDIAINDPDPTPTPTSAPTSTSVPTPTSKSVATATIKPTLTSIPSVTSIASITTIASDSGYVLGSSTSGLSLVDGIEDKKEKSVNFLAIGLIISGILLLSSCGILFFYKWRKSHTFYEHTDE